MKEKNKGILADNPNYLGLGCVVVARVSKPKHKHS